MNNLKKKAVNGFKWSVFNKISIHLSRFILGTILARLLGPEAYGTIALLTIFLSISDVFINSGFSLSLIQKQTNDEADYSTVFYFNVFISIISWFVLYGARHLIADFYKQGCLIKIIPFVSLGLIISALSLVHRTKLEMDFKFKDITISTVFSYVIGGISAIFFAYKGLGVWSLVYQTLLSKSILTLLFWIKCKWIPKKFIKIEALKSLTPLSFSILVSSLIAVFFENLNGLIIGKVFKTSELGFFNRANMLKNIPLSSAGDAILKVGFPAYSKIKNDDNKIIEKTIEILRLIILIIAPMMLGMSVLASEIILVILGREWIKAAEYLPYVCVLGIFLPIHYVTSMIVRVKNAKKKIIKAELYKRILHISALSLTYSFGIKYMLVGNIVVSILMLLINGFYVKSLIDLQIKKLLVLYVKMLSYSLIMSVFVYLFKQMISDSLICLITSTIFGIISYYALLNLFKVSEVKYINTFVKNKIIRRMNGR